MAQDRDDPEREASEHEAASDSHAAGEATPDERRQVTMRRRQVTLRRRAARRAGDGGGAPLPDGVRAKMERSFGRSLGDVRLHRDGLAEERGALAFTEGQDIHLQRAIDPESDRGQRLLGHELAHVVQQHGADEAVQEKSSATPTLADHALEREADEAARKAHVGQSVAGAIAGRVRLQAPQHFESGEHKLIGDEGSAGADGEAQGVELAPGYKVSYGDIVAMAGDFFGSIEVLRAYAANPAKGPGGREEVEYVRLCRVRGDFGQAGKFSDEAKKAADKRYYDLATKNRSHFLNASAGDQAKSVKDRDAELDPDKNPADQNGPGLNAGSSYKEGHRNALLQAARDAKAGKPIDPALSIEAFSNHYLTDSFSAGHLRTPRGDVKSYWDAKVPLFFANFKGFMAEQIAKHIPPGALHGAARVLTVDTLTNLDTSFAQGTRPTIEKTLADKGIPPFGFGDMMSGALHDFDNVNGVQARVDGQLVTLYGDGQILSGGKELAGGATTKQLAERAVRTSLEDVKKAYDAGSKGRAAEEVLASFLDDGGLFAAERLLPVVVPDADPAQVSKSIKWDYPSAEALLADAQVQLALATVGREKAGELAAIGDSLDADFKRAAFREGVVKPLKADPVAFLRDVINYVPDTGGGVAGHDTDDEALDYLQQARATPGGIASLTVEQKQKLIKDVVSGYTAGDEEAAILEILAAKKEDAPALIAHESWHRLWRTIDGEHCRTFVEAFGADYWRGRSLDEKQQEVKFLADGRTNDLAQETIIVILRTCSPDQVRAIDSHVGGLLGLGFDLDGPWNRELKRLKGDV